MGILSFNGTPSSYYGVYVMGKGAFNAPELDYTTVSVPGRNGDIIISNNRYKNVVVPYEAYIHKDFREKSERARAWLLSPQGYRRLTDEYNPSEYRLAIFRGPLDFDMRFMNKSGTCTLTFDCKPQRFLLSGETTQLFTESGQIITNPTLFNSLPVIEISNSGTGRARLTINGYTLDISGFTTDGLTLDCETQNAYRGLTNLNRTISGDFPILSPGENIIAWSGDIEDVSVIPRWWTL